MSRACNFPSGLRWSVKTRGRGGREGDRNYKPATTGVLYTVSYHLSWTVLLPVLPLFFCYE
jgi:hypothetical protein